MVVEEPANPEYRFGCYRNPIDCLSPSHKERWCSDLARPVAADGSYRPVSLGAHGRGWGCQVIEDKCCVIALSLASGDVNTPPFVISVVSVFRE